MRASCLFVLLLIPSFVASAQSLGSGTITLGAGGAFPASGYRTLPFHSGVSFSGEYELGLHRYLAATLGLDNFVLNFDSFSRTSVTQARERVTLLPFGLRAIVPIAGRRAELFAGTGAAYLWSSAYDLQNFGGQGFLWQLNGGARVAIDREKHWRLGTTARYYRDLGRPTQQWVSLSGDVSYRF